MFMDTKMSVCEYVRIYECRVRVCVCVCMCESLKCEVAVLGAWWAVRDRSAASEHSRPPARVTFPFVQVLIANSEQIQ